MEVTGLKWVTYIGPSSCVTPAGDPVLMSYAELLSQVTYMYVRTDMCVYAYICSVCIRLCACNVCVCSCVYLVCTNMCMSYGCVCFVCACMYALRTYINTTQYMYRCKLVYKIIGNHKNVLHPEY